MSRDQTAGSQTSISGGTENIVVSLPQDIISCPVTSDIFFEPVTAMPCGHCFEHRESVKLKNACPCCRSKNVTLYPAPPIIRELLSATLSQNPALYEQVHFDSEYFTEIVQKNEFGVGTTGEHFLTLLKNAPKHLNRIPIIHTQTQVTFPEDPRVIPEYSVTQSVGKSAIEILASTPEGRTYLRNNSTIDPTSKKYFFGDAEITAESLQIQVNGKNIREWLSMTTAKEQSLNQFRLFLSRGAQGASAESDDRVSAELQPLLKAAFDADLDGVKRIIEETRPEDRGALLSTPASANYPETEIHVDTAFKVALATADEEMAVEIAQYLDPTEIARQFKNVFGPDYTAFQKQQEREAEALFEGLEAAFSCATETEVQNALNHVPNTASVLQQKIAEFKIKLEAYVNRTHPLHNDYILAKAFEIYDRNWNPWSGEQLCLFSQPVIGLIQASALKTSIKRSMDITEGIYHRAQNVDNGSRARRSLLFAGSTTDIRSVGDLGSRCCIDIFGLPVAATRAGGAARHTKIVSSKHISFGKLMQRSKSHQSHTRPGCSVM